MTEEYEVRRRQAPVVNDSPIRERISDTRRQSVLESIGSRLRFPKFRPNDIVRR